MILKSMFKSMLHRQLSQFSVELQNAYSLKFKVKDVIKMRGLATLTPYVILEGQRLEIPVNKILAYVIRQSPFFKPDQPIKINFLDTDLNTYIPACPTLALLQNNFYIKLNNELYFVANQQSLIKTSFNAEYIATDAPPCLQPIMDSTIKSLDQIPQYITPFNFNTMIIKNVMDQTITYKMQKIRIKQLLRIIDTRLKSFDGQIQAINEIVSRKAKNRTRLFSSFMVGQYAIIHYLIYFHLSWDIMEPITVILTNLDILIGYYFFVFKGRQYSLQQLQKNMQQKHKYNYLKKYKFNLQKYEQLLELKQYFQFKLDLYSKSPFVIMDRLEKPLRLLDTR